MGVYFQDVSVQGVLIGPNHKVRTIYRCIYKKSCKGTMCFSTVNVIRCISIYLKLSLGFFQ